MADICRCGAQDEHDHAPRCQPGSQPALDIQGLLNLAEDYQVAAGWDETIEVEHLGCRTPDDDLAMLYDAQACAKSIINAIIRHHTTCHGVKRAGTDG